jgi:hypothetical protein
MMLTPVCSKYYLFTHHQAKTVHLYELSSLETLIQAPKNGHISDYTTVD